MREAAWLEVYPMVTGHTSHQIGLDVDIWLTPMPDRILTPQERENMTAVSMLKDPFTVARQVDPTSYQAHQARGVLSRGGPHLCASSHQESAV
jgi:murein endopeptidase